MNDFNEEENTKMRAYLRKEIARIDRDTQTSVIIISVCMVLMAVMVLFGDSLL